MALTRSVEPELLDHLDAHDPRAVRSRDDLRRINRIMATRAIMQNAFGALPGPRRIIELGAGDGTLMLDLARHLTGRWPAVHLTLLDRQNLVAPQTAKAFNALGWRLDMWTGDVLDWINEAAPDRYDLVVANLFLHHFKDPELGLLLGTIAKRSNAFFACEPRRARMALAASHLVGLIGANAVTREDAVLSVRAGFARDELARMWPQQEAEWQVREYNAGLFSHCLLAQRRSGR